MSFNPLSFEPENLGINIINRYQVESTLSGHTFSHRIKKPFNDPITPKKQPTKFFLNNEDVVERILKSTSQPTGVMNFASAVHPGGAFLEGAHAQEEALMYASFTYPELLNFVPTFYRKNQLLVQKTQHHLYSNDLIYSQHVPFVGHSDGTPIKHAVFCDVVTVPAPNLNMTHLAPSDPQVVKILTTRIHNTLDAFHHYGAKNLILGAFGCGVFGNDPFIVARIFNEQLNVDFKDAFNRITFSVYGKDANYYAFKDQFQTEFTATQRRKNNDYH